MLFFSIVFQTVQALISNKIFGFTAAGQSESHESVCSVVQSLLKRKRGR